MKPECGCCKWLSNEFTSVCCNDKSHKCGDFVDLGYVCPYFESGLPQGKKED